MCSIYKAKCLLIKWLLVINAKSEKLDSVQFRYYSRRANISTLWSKGTAFVPNLLLKGDFSSADLSPPSVMGGRDSGWNYSAFSELWTAASFINWYRIWIYGLLSHDKPFNKFRQSYILSGVGVIIENNGVHDNIFIELIVVIMQRETDYIWFIIKGYTLCGTFPQ